MQLLFCTSSKYLASSFSGKYAACFESETTVFSNKEMIVQIKGTIDRSRPLYVVQTTALQSINDQLIELVLTLDALKRMGVSHIHVVLPYLPYSRQDRTMSYGYSVGCKVVANMLSQYCITGITTLDIHNDKTMAFIDGEFVNILAEEVFKKHITENFPNISETETVFVSLDIGGSGRATSFAKMFNTDYVVIDKRRLSDGTVESTRIIGEIKGKKCIVVDDIVDTGRTLFAGADLLAENGAKEIFCYITHPAISGPEKFVADLARSKITHLTTSNTINNIVVSPKISYVDCAETLFNSIKARNSLFNASSSIV